MKISLSETAFFDRGDFTGNVYVAKDEGKGFNALLVDCLKGHYKTKLKNATRVYLVLQGKGTFMINGETKEAQVHDLFLISDGDTYEYAGAMKLFEFNVPGTDSANEEKI